MIAQSEIQEGPWAELPLGRRKLKRVGTWRMGSRAN
jgi:hypothetical protein